MQRLNSVNPQEAQGRTKEALNKFEKAFGGLPNAAKVMANSPAVLESYLALNHALKRSSLDDKLKAQVKISVSETNQCGYCSSLLSALGPKLGLTADDILDAKQGGAEEVRTDAALKFANEVLESRGKVTGPQLDAVRNAGFNDGEIVEIIASVIVGSFTNFINNVAETELDTGLQEGATCSSGSCSSESHQKEETCSAEKSHAEGATCSSEHGASCSAA